MGLCEHRRGAWIEEMGYWLCADCFAKLDSQPKKYGPVSKSMIATDLVLVHRQEIVWQAEIATGPEGLTLNDFLRTMARHYGHRAQLDLQDAYDISIETLRAFCDLFGDRFGDPEYGWSFQDARDMVDEELSYWDCDGGASNNQ